jgi:hypothetical protein
VVSDDRNGGASRASPLRVDIAAPGFGLPNPLESNQK